MLFSSSVKCFTLDFVWLFLALVEHLLCYKIAISANGGPVYVLKLNLYTVLASSLGTVASSKRCEYKDVFPRASTRQQRRGNHFYTNLKANFGRLEVNMEQYFCRVVSWE